MRTLLLVCLSLSFAGCRTSDQPPESAKAAANHLLAKINERLLLMEDVARYKWVNKRPIEDPEREAKLLAEMEKRAEEHRLMFVRQFFKAQIEAAKVLQSSFFETWSKGTGPTAGGDLDEVRAKIDRLNGELLTAYKDYDAAWRTLTGTQKIVLKSAMPGQAKELFERSNIDWNVWHIAIEPLTDRP